MSTAKSSRRKAAWTVNPQRQALAAQLARLEQQIRALEAEQPAAGSPRAPAQIGSTARIAMPVDANSPPAVLGGDDLPDVRAAAVAMFEALGFTGVTTQNGQNSR